MAPRNRSEYLSLTTQEESQLGASSSMESSLQLSASPPSIPSTQRQRGGRKSAPLKASKRVRTPEEYDEEEEESEAEEQDSDDGYEETTPPPKPSRSSKSKQPRSRQTQSKSQAKPSKSSLSSNVMGRSGFQAAASFVELFQTEFSQICKQMDTKRQSELRSITKTRLPKALRAFHLPKITELQKNKEHLRNKVEKKRTQALANERAAVKGVNDKYEKLVSAELDNLKKSSVSIESLFRESKVNYDEILKSTKNLS